MVVMQVWLTTKEAAEYLGVSDKQLRRWRQAKGAGPVVRPLFRPHRPLSAGRAGKVQA
jgi:hypothetical protein